MNIDVLIEKTMGDEKSLSPTISKSDTYTAFMTVFLLSYDEIV